MSDQDQIVEELIKQVNAKAKEIKDLNNPSWKTCCSITFYDGKVNLHVESDIGKLLSILAYFELVNERAVKLAKEIGVQIKEVPIHGYSLKEWKHDITVRINKIGIKQKQDQLKNLENRLDSILTPEQKRKFEIERIMKEMQSI